MAKQPLLHCRGLVRGGVVEHDVDVKLERYGLVDLGEEGQELRCPVSPTSGGDDLTGGYIERREQVGDAVADVVVSPTLDLAWAHRQDRLCPVECLDAGLLVDADDNGSLGRVQVQPDNIADLLDEQRVL